MMPKGREQLGQEPTSDLTVEQLLGVDQRVGAGITETSAEAAERLRPDLEWIEKLTTAGYSGPVFDAFSNMLWTYALPVLLDFLGDGRIIALCSSRGVVVQMNDLTRRALHTSPVTRDEYAVDVIAWSIRYFRDSVLVPGKWRPGPGQASLKTYFVGTCAFGFAHVLRKRQAKVMEIVADESVLTERLPLIEQSLQPADRAVIMDTLRRILDRAPAETRTVCGLILQGYTHREIADQLGGSERSVEGHMRRLRLKARRMARRGEIDLPFSTNVGAAA